MDILVIQMSEALLTLADAFALPPRGLEACHDLKPEALSKWIPQVREEGGGGRRQEGPRALVLDCRFSR